MLNIKQVPATIERIDAYSEDLKVFRLKLPEGSGFSFTPGQFVMASLPGLVDRNGRKIAKSFSIASSAAETGSVELCVARFPTGALSVPLFKKQVGDEVVIAGPYGVFQLKKPVQAGTVFMAGGTGLAPLMSMLSSLYSEGFSHQLWLFYSVSEPQLLMFKDELLGYSKNNGLKLIASTSNPGGALEFEKGRVTDTFPKYLPQLQSDGIRNEERQFYVCGPPLMVTDTVKMLEQLGFRKENIHREQW